MKRIQDLSDDELVNTYIRAMQDMGYTACVEKFGEWRERLDPMMSVYFFMQNETLRRSIRSVINCGFLWLATRPNPLYEKLQSAIKLHSGEAARESALENAFLSHER